MSILLFRGSGFRGLGDIMSIFTIITVPLLSLLFRV